MATKKVIDILINATDKASGVLKKNSKNLKKHGKVVATTAGIIGVTAVRAAAKFEKQMANISTLISGDATESMKVLESGIKSMLMEMPVDPDELGASAYDIFSAGITDAADALSVLESSSRLAVTGLGTASEATDLMTSAINAFGLDASKSNDTADILFKTVQRGKTTVAGLKQSFGVLAPVAVAAGASFQEVQAATAAMTTTGLNASVAQNQLKALFTEMTKEGNKLTGALHDMGVGNIEAAIAAEGFVPLLERLKEETNLTDAEFKNLFGSVEAQGAALSLTGEQATIYADTMADMLSGMPAIDEAFVKQTATFDAQAKILKNQLTVAMVDIGTVVLPAMTEAMSGFGDHLKTVIDLTTTQNEAIAKNKTAYDEVKTAVDSSRGANEEFLEQLQESIKFEKAANEALRKGRSFSSETFLAEKDKEVQKMKDWLKTNRGSLSLSSDAFEGFSKETVMEIAKVDKGLAKNIKIMQAVSKKTDSELVQAAIGYAVFKDTATLSLSDFSSEAQTKLLEVAASASESGVHLLANYIQGIESQIPNLSGTVGRVVEMVNRLKFSKNPEMPMMESGQHAMEEFAGGIIIATPAVNGAVGNIVTIVNGFGQEVQATLTDTGGFWQTFTTEIDESAKAQEEMAKNGIDAIAELSEEYEDKVGAIKEELAELAVGMQDIFSEFSERESKNRTDLAEAVVGSEKRAADLRVQIAKEEDGVKRSVLQSQLEAEIASLEANKELIATIESEITEVKRVNSLTRVEKAVEAFKEEQAALNAWKTEALAAWDEQFAKAGTTLEGIKDLWADRTEAVKSLMGEEMASNEALSTAVADSTKEVVALIQQLNNLKAAQSSVGMSVSASIPAMADGGIVTKPTVALIGEAGPEAIVPLSGGNMPGGGNTIIVQNHGVISSKEQLIEMLNPVIQELGLDNRF